MRARSSLVLQQSGHSEVRVSITPKPAKLGETHLTPRHSPDAEADHPEHYAAEEEKIWLFKKHQNRAEGVLVFTILVIKSSAAICSARH